MNKLLIVLLAVCLVSVHAFVKRDAPAAKPKDGVDLDKIGEDIAGIAKKIGDDLKQTFDAEKLKKGFNEGVDQIKDFVNNLGKDNKPAAA